MILEIPESLAETLEMNNFTLSQISDRVTNVRVFNDTEDVVISGSCLLFWCDLVKTTYKNTRKNR